MDLHRGLVGAFMSSFLRYKSEHDARLVCPWIVNFFAEGREVTTSRSASRVHFFGS